MKRTAKGSLTIFALLSLMLVASLLLVLLEAGRMHQIRLVAQMNTESVLESVFANYQRAMWDNYQLLVLDNGRNGEQEGLVSWEWYVKSLSEENVSSSSSKTGSNHLSLSVDQATFEEYRLITDDNGKVYISAISQYMREHLTEAALGELLTLYESIQNMNAGELPDDSAITNADQAIEVAQEDTLQGETTTDTEIEQELGGSVQVAENPLQIIKQLWNTGVLKLVIKDTDSVSSAKESMADAVSGRTLQKGTALTTVQTEFSDNVLFSKYLLEHFACYTQGEAAGTLQYELEYLLCGKDRDDDNLCGAVERLLAVREAANLISLAADPEKQEVAYTVALALAGATANPFIIYAVKSGLLSAWALAESILDLRTLLSGGKIAIVKSSKQWTTDLLHLGEAFSSFGKAVNCSNGLSYQQYLGTLLIANVQKTAFRAMDIQELAIRGMEGYEEFCMDNMVTDAVLSVDYRYRTIFLGMEAVTEQMERTFTITTQTELSYRKAGA